MEVSDKLINDTSKGEQNVLELKCRLAQLEQEVASLKKEKTAWEQTQEAPKAEYQHSNTVLESITDGFIAFDPEWNFTYLNSEGAQTVGRPAQELADKFERQDCGCRRYLRGNYRQKAGRR